MALTFRALFVLPLDGFRALFVLPLDGGMVQIMPCHLASWIVPRLPEAMKKAFDLHVNGIVQGVGFRPFVYRLALRHSLKGWVLNAGDGVDAHIEGEQQACLDFLEALEREAPAAAFVEQLSSRLADIEDYANFQIRPSKHAEGAASTLISPDLATCQNCLQELFDPNDRRYLYPFINCTDCGPRFTIIEALPYDRPLTTMRDFQMCPSCAEEYHDPAQRRFHAQPDACFQCGPQLALWQQPEQPAAAGQDDPTGEVIGGKTASPTAAEATTGGEGPAGEGPAGEAAAERAIAGRRAQSQALIRKAATALATGQIVAIKGLGGYHLACDATNEAVVARLRQRKHRLRKPLAIMVRDLADARRFASVSAAEAELLVGSIRPIVLLSCVGDRVAAASAPGADADAGVADAAATVEKGGAAATAAATAGITVTAAATVATPAVKLAPSVAAGLPEVGVMLPYTPLQHLLLAELDFPLVMTSGNVSDEPIIGDADEAHHLLANIADLFLDHNRAIRSRYDDSVVRAGTDATMFIRRARGYAPRPLRLPQATPLPLLACGPEQKNTLCLAKGYDAFVSQHLGDMDDAHALANWNQTRQLYQQLFRIEPELLVTDKHPEYLTGKWAAAESGRCGLPLLQVQHHHAHIAAVLAEAKSACPQETPDEVIGLAFDGTGYGDDGTIWGGEVLLASLKSYERAFYLRPVAMPGGAAAIKNPDRMAYAWLADLGMLGHPGAQSLLKRIGATQCEQLATIIASGRHAPMTSSMGRLFDAISALCGLCAEASYEGEAAVLLEAEMWKQGRESVAVKPYAFTLHDGLIDPAPAFQAALDDLEQGICPAYVSHSFHDAVIAMAVALACTLRQSSGLDSVAFSGGVFTNRYLSQKLPGALDVEGFQVLTNKELPANDGCIAYGQAAIAAALKG